MGFQHLGDLGAYGAESVVCDSACENQTDVESMGTELVSDENNEGRLASFSEGYHSGFMEGHQQGHYEGETSDPGHSFESIAMPAALKKGIGVLAMKVTARNQLMNDKPELSRGRDLIRYALSLPISLAVVGMSQHGHVRANSELARSFESMPETEREKLAASVSSEKRAALGRYFLHHRDT